ARTWLDQGYWLLPPLLLLAALAFRRGAALLALPLLLWLLPAAPSFAQDSPWLRPDQQAQRHLEHGVEAYRRGDFAAATEAVARRPGTAAATGWRDRGTTRRRCRRTAVPWRRRRTWRARGPTARWWKRRCAGSRRARTAPASPASAIARPRSGATAPVPPPARATADRKASRSQGRRRRPTHRPGTRRKRRAGMARPRMPRPRVHARSRPIASSASACARRWSGRRG